MNGKKIKPVLFGWLSLILGVAFLLAPALADGPATTRPKPATTQAKLPPADPSVPVVKGDPNDPKNIFLKQHEDFVKIAKAGGVDLLFLGDSITAGWRGVGQGVWKQHYDSLHAANFGIGGDQTQHVLWRIENGELDGIHPKIVVLMIGTNNLGNPSNEAIAGGITTIVKTIQQKLPETKIMLLAIFPRGEKAGTQFRTRIKAINAIIAKLDDGKSVRYLDIGDKFLDPDGTLPKTIMPDFLHPNDKGYQIWADAIGPVLDEMMK